MKFFALTSYAIVAAALAIVGNAGPTPASEEKGAPAPHAMSDAEFDNWLATTNAKITWYGEKVSNPLAPRSGMDTRVIYCNRIIGNDCGGDCTVYTGGEQCIPAPTTQCVSETSNVIACTRPNCTGICRQTRPCSRPLSRGFCATPGTESLFVIVG